jgi:hypothetical protein
MMKVTGVMGSAYSMIEEEVDKFLESKLNLYWLPLMKWEILAFNLSGSNITKTRRILSL